MKHILDLNSDEQIEFQYGYANAYSKLYWFWMTLGNLFAGPNKFYLAMVYGILARREHDEWRKLHPMTGGML